jgi:hypothetical protein
MTTQNETSSLFRRVANWFSGTATPSKVRRSSPRIALESLEKRDCPATLQGYVSALVNTTRADAEHLVRDAAYIEYYRPTFGSSTIYQDLVRINSDVQYGAPLVQMFNDFAPLVRHLNQEAAIASYYHLSPAAALANYTAIQSDFRAVGTDYAATVILLEDLTVHAPTTVLPTAAPVSGLSQVYADLNAMGRFGGLTPAQSPALQSLISSIPPSAYSTNQSVIAVNQAVDHLLGA